MRKLGIADFCPIRFPLFLFLPVASVFRAVRLSERSCAAGDPGSRRIPERFRMGALDPARRRVAEVPLPDDPVVRKIFSGCFRRRSQGAQFSVVRRIAERFRGVPFRRGRTVTFGGRLTGRKFRMAGETLRRRSGDKGPLSDARNGMFPRIGFPLQTRLLRTAYFRSRSGFSGCVGLRAHLRVVVRAAVCPEIHRMAPCSLRGNAVREKGGRKRRVEPCCGIFGIVPGLGLRQRFPAGGSARPQPGPKIRRSSSAHRRR